MSKKDSNHPIQEKNGKGKGKPIDPFLALRLHKGEPIAPHYKEHKKKKLVRGPVDPRYKDEKRTKQRGIIGTIAGKEIGQGKYVARSGVMPGKSEVQTKFRRGGMQPKAKRSRRKSGSFNVQKGKR